MRYIWNLWEEMLNIGLRIQRLSLGEPHDALGKIQELPVVVPELTEFLFQCQRNFKDIPF